MRWLDEGGLREVEGKYEHKNRPVGWGSGRLVTYVWRLEYDPRLRLQPARDVSMKIKAATGTIRTTALRLPQEGS